MAELHKVQGQLLLLTVGMAFLIAVVVFGAGIGAVLWQQSQLAKEIRVEFAYAQDMAATRHRETEELIRGHR